MALKQTANRWVFFLGNLFYLIPLFYFGFSAWLLVFIHQHNYNDIKSWFTSNVPGIYNPVDFFSRCFTNDWYESLSRYHYFILTAIGCSAIIYLVFYKRVLSFLTRFIRSIVRLCKLLAECYSSMPRSQKTIFWVFMCGLLVYRLFWYFNFPVYIDELCSYQLYANAGPLVSMTVFPTTNNHIFYNTCSSFICYFLPGDQSTVSIRFLSMAGDLFLFSSLFLFLKRYAGFQKTCFVVIGVAFTYLLSYYNWQGRGYQWQEITGVLSLFSGGAWFFYSRHRYRFGKEIFVISSIAGFYINPVYLYHHLALCILFLFLFLKSRDTKGAMIFLFFNLIIGLMVLLLYLPVIIASNPASVAGNPYIFSDATVDQLFGKWPSGIALVNYVTHIGQAGIYIVGAFLVAITWYCIRNKSQKLLSFGISYTWALLLSLLILTLFTRSLPIERGLCFTVLICGMIFHSFLYDVLSSWSRHSASVIIGILLIKLVFTVRPLYWEKYNVKQLVPVKKTERGLSVIGYIYSFHPKTWQVNGSDFYYMYIKDFLSKKHDPGVVNFGQQETGADVILTSTSFLPIVDSSKYQFLLTDSTNYGALPVAIYLKKKGVNQ
jgi:hypothetical protein